MLSMIKCIFYWRNIYINPSYFYSASNIIRESNALKLTNLGAACKHTNKELVSAELQQLAYAAPELALLQRHTDDAHRRAVSRGGEQVNTPFVLLNIFYCVIFVFFFHQPMITIQRINWTTHLFQFFLLSRLYMILISTMLRLNCVLLLLLQWIFQSHIPTPQTWPQCQM